MTMHLRTLALALSGAFFLPSAVAQAARYTDLGGFTFSTSGSSININGSGAGSPLASRTAPPTNGSGFSTSVPNSTWHGSMKVPSGMGTASYQGNVYTGQRGQVPVPGAKSPVTIDTTAKVIKNPVFAKSAMKVLRALPVIGTGVALYDFFKDMGATPEKDPATGEVRFYKLESGLTIKEQEWGDIGSPPYGGYPTFSGWFTANQNEDQLCANWFGNGFSYAGVRITSNQFAYIKCSGPGGDPVRTPMTDAEVEQRIESNPWPNNDNAPKAVRDMLDAGEPVPIDAPQVSGPTSAPGPTTTKTEQTTNSSGQPVTKQSTTTSTVTITYGPANTINYNTTNQTTTTTTNNVTNETTTETSTEVKEAQPREPEPEISVTDPTMPGIPTLYTPKYPNGFAGVFNEKKTQLQATPLYQLGTGLAPNLGDSGNCPSWSIPLDVGLFNFGVRDVSIPCNVWAFLRICMIVGALFLARALIFGG